MVDDGELIDQKVDERAALGHVAVGLTRLLDHLGRRNRHLLLLVDLAHGGLGLLERDDQVLVRQDVALGVGQPLQQVVLELLQPDGKLVLLLHELDALLLEVGPLLVDGPSEQLVLETPVGHGEVDEGRLRLQLGDVVRVGQLGLHVEPEERRGGRVALGVLAAHQVHLVVAELDHHLTSGQRAVSSEQ